MWQPRNRTFALLLLACFWLAGATRAAARHPLTFDDLIAFGRVSDPQLSPDGRWVAYVVDHYDKASNQRRSSIWLASLETGENRELTRSPAPAGRDRTPRWSPHNFVPKFKTPTLAIHGGLDHRVPLDQGLQLFTHLQRQGMPSKLLYFPDEGHWILKPQNAELWYKTVRAWLATYLK